MLDVSVNFLHSEISYRVTVSKSLRVNLFVKLLSLGLKSKEVEGLKSHPYNNSLFQEVNP